MQNSGKILHADHQGVHVLRYVGDIRYPISPSLEDFIERLFRAETPAGFVIDLCEATDIDSTNLGLLANLANRMRDCGAPQITIVCDEKGINELLASMGFDEIFNIVVGNPIASAEGEEVPVEQPQSEAMARTVLKAHRTLMELNETNRSMFADVVKALEKSGTEESD